MITGAGTNRKQTSEKRRTAILDAARTVFARQGYERTVVENIAQQAGLGKGTLYLYFRSKEEIYLAALLEDARQLDAQTRDGIAKASDWRDAVKAYVSARLRYFEAHADFLRIFVTEFRGRCILGQPLNPELFRLVEDGVAQLAQVFAAATARGEIRKIDPELAAMTVADLTRGLMERSLRQWGRPMSPADAEFALDVFCRGLEALPSSVPLPGPGISSRSR